MDKTKFNTIIVEDNPTDRYKVLKTLKASLFEEINLDEMVVFTNLEEAKTGVLQLMLKDWPDLILLDLQLNGNNYGGYDLIDYLIAKIHEIPCAIIIMTNYPEQAIEWGRRIIKSPQLIDYILKEEYRGKNLSQQLQSAIGKLKSQIISIYTRAAGIEHAGIRFILAHNIYFIKADNNYSIVHLSEEVISAQKKFGDFIEELPFDNFMRVHRSYYVNISHIKEVQPRGMLPKDHAYSPFTAPRGGIIILKNGERIPVASNDICLQLQSRIGALIGNE